MIMEAHKVSFAKRNVIVLQTVEILNSLYDMIDMVLEMHSCYKVSLFI